MSLLDANFFDNKPELVDSSGLVRHTCRHEVFWELFPGVPDDFLRVVSFFPCPCCGGETGSFPGSDKLEWPDHAGIAGVGLAHCHRRWQKCADVHMMHRLGLATPDNEQAAGRLADGAGVVDRHAVTTPIA